MNIALPVAAEKTDVFVFKGWRLAKRRILAAHAAAARGPGLVVLLGPAASGKSLMLRRMVYEWRSQGETVRRTRDAVAAVQSRQVLIIDDAQDLDDATLHALIADPPCFCLLAGRPDLAHRLGNVAPSPTIATLDPLDEPEIRQFIDRFYAAQNRATQNRAAENEVQEHWSDPPPAPTLPSFEAGVLWYPGPLAEALRRLSEFSLGAAATPGEALLLQTPSEIPARPALEEPRAADAIVRDLPSSVAPATQGQAAALHPEPAWPLPVAGVGEPERAPGRSAAAAILIDGARRPARLSRWVMVGAGLAAVLVGVAVLGADRGPPRAIAGADIRPHAVTRHAANPDRLVGLAAPPVYQADGELAPIQGRTGLRPDPTGISDQRAGLASSAPPRVELVVWSGDDAGALVARAIADRLQDIDVVITRPPTALSRPSASAIRYFYEEDHDRAAAMQHQLGALVGSPTLATGPTARHRRPGTLEIVISPAQDGSH